MCTQLSELRCREVINVSDGCRLGYVSDLKLELETGRVLALTVPCPGRFFGLFYGKEEYVIPWQSICRIGDDIILVNVCPQEIRQSRKKICVKW